MDNLCATCGKQLQAGQGFCDQCGSAWTPATEGIPASPVLTPMAVAVPPPAKNSNKTLIGVLIAGIIALLLGGWFFMTHRALAGSPDAATAGTATSASTTVVPTSSAGEPAGAAAVVPPVTDSTAPAPSEAEIAAATAAATSSKQCSLITPAEMESILGSKIVKLTASELTCSYFTEDKRYTTVDTTWTGGKESLATTKGFPGAEDFFKPIPGIGDEAYSQAGGVLHVLKGNTYVVVNSRQYPNDEEIESAIARKIVANLK